MPKRDKESIAELERENQRLKEDIRTDVTVRAVNRAVSYLFITVNVWLITDCIKECAGKTTFVHFLIDFLGDLTISTGVAWTSAVSALAWAILERHFRKSKTAYLAARVRNYEQQKDPGRSSSDLTAHGDTNPNDR